MTNKKSIIIFIAIIILAAASRLIDHPYNFTPLGAMALFAGAYGMKKYWIVLPLAVLLIGDYFLGFYNWPVMAAVYGSFALAFVIGWQMRKRVKWQNIAAASLVSSIVFFLITNFAVWAFASWYPHTLAGLLNCFTLAIPFFRNTLLGDLVYSAALFGGYELVSYFVVNSKTKFASRNM